MKRVPSFSARPGFPCGLQVLLVETDKHSREKVSKQLKQLSYIGTCCSSTVEAAGLLSTHAGAFDIVLAEAKAVAHESPAFVNALDGMPLILMSEGGSACEVWKSIELGAVEYLEKPLSQLKLRNIWQHVVRKMMQGSEQEDSSCRFSPKDNGPSPSSLLQQKSLSNPDSPSTPSELSSGIDPEFTLDDSLRSFKLYEGNSSSSHSDPSDLFLPDISSDTSDNRLLLHAPSTGQISSGSTPVPAAKKLRRSNTKDSSTVTNTAASVTHRPPLAIRPAPSMMPQAMMGVGGGQWGYQNMPGYVWGTPLPHNPVPLDRSSSWQVPPCQSSVFPMQSGDLQCHHSLPVEYSSLSSLPSQASCNSGCIGLVSSLSLDLGPDKSLLDTLPTFGDLSFESGLDSHAPKSPPIGLQLRKSESFLELINEHLQQANSAGKAS